MAEMTEESGVCTVYLWSTDKYGHISLGARDLYISFWPKEKAKGLGSVPGRRISSFDKEVRKLGSPDETYYAADMNIDKIKIWWKEFSEKDPEWSLLIKSCSNIVYKALGVGSDRFKGRVEGFATTPKAVAELVMYDMDKKRGKIRCGSSCMPSPE